LGGIAFSDTAIFKTKAKGENVESVQEWDCKYLRELLTETKNRKLTINHVLKKITFFSQKKCKRSLDSFFEVTLYGVSSFRNYIFDITKVKRYLSQVAPVPFHPNHFSYGQAIDQYLEQNLKHYRKYNVILNGERIFKPYKDIIKITKGGFDRLTGIKFFDLRDENGESMAYGWLGDREKLLGSIIKGDDSSGIRVRVGNIMIGDEHLLDRCFREPRFNSYVVGEIHIEYDGLIPNSRRDDFVDNRSKNIFYNSVEKQIGLPISKEIRLKSRIKSECLIKMTPVRKEEERADKTPLPILESEPEKEANTTKASKEQPDIVLTEIMRTCKDCPKFTEIIREIFNRNR
jgi:molecular chaperone HtpG